MSVISKGLPRYRGFVEDDVSGDVLITLNHCKYKGRWVYGDCVSLPESGEYVDYIQYYVYSVIDSPSIVRARIVPGTLCERVRDFTDSENTPVYEGDIVRFISKEDYACYLESLEFPECYGGKPLDDDAHYAAVVWLGKSFACPSFDLIPYAEDSECECNVISYIQSEDCHVEVCGNVFSDPTLLHPHQVCYDGDSIKIL